MSALPLKWGLAGACVLALLVRPVAAQTQEPEANRGQDRVRTRALFGSGLGDVAQSLAFDASVAGGMEQLLPTFDGDPVSTDAWPVAFGSAGLSYNLDLAHLITDVRVGSFATYAPRISDRAEVGHDARLSLSSGFQLGARTHLGMTAGVAYQPVSVLNMFPDMFSGAVTPQALVDYQFDGPAEEYWSGSASVTLSQQLSRRAQLSFAYYEGYTRASDVLGAQNNRSAVVNYSHMLAQGLSFRAGYGRRVGRYGRDAGGDAETVRNHDINVGLDFNRTLSFSRRTSLAFSTGTTAVSDGVSTRYDIVGSAALSHEVSRTWTANLAYNRRAEFVTVIAQPVFSDSLSANVGGLVGRRVNIQAGTGTSLGTAGITGADDNSYRAFHATVSAQTALTSTIGVTVGYTYYSYRFDSADFLPSTVRQRDRRQTLHASVDLFLPLLQGGTRSPNVAR